MGLEGVVVLLVAVLVGRGGEGCLSAEAWASDGDVGRRMGEEVAAVVAVAVAVASWIKVRHGRAKEGRAARGGKVSGGSIARGAGGGRLCEGVDRGR